MANNSRGKTTKSALGFEIDLDGRNDNITTSDPNVNYMDIVKRQIAEGASPEDVSKTLTQHVNQAWKAGTNAWTPDANSALDYVLTFYDVPDTYIDAGQAAAATQQYNQDLAAGKAQPGELPGRVAALEQPIANMNAAVPQTGTTTTGTPDATMPTGTTVTSPTTAQGTQTTPTTPTTNNYSDYIKEAYDAQKEAALSALDAAYKKNVATLDTAEKKIPAIYEAARNSTAGSAAVAQRNFNQQAAAMGLNSGASAQASLASGLALQGNLNELNTAQANALADIQLQRSNIATEYENAVAQAEANGNYELAAALYQEGVRVDEFMAEQERYAYSKQQSEQQNSLEMAQYLYQNAGDASGFAAFGFTPEQIAAMETRWQEAQAQKANAGKSTGTTASAKPTLTAAQVLQALENGIVNDQTLEAYEYYFGEPWRDTSVPAPLPTPTAGTLPSTVATIPSSTRLNTALNFDPFQTGGLYNATPEEIIGVAPSAPAHTTQPAGTQPDAINTPLSTVEFAPVPAKVRSYLAAGRFDEADAYIDSIVGRMNETQYNLVMDIFNEYGR